MRYSERKGNIMKKCGCRFASALLKLLLKVLLIGLIGFAVTFAIYFFNLDMKLTSVMEPILFRHYDKIERDTHL